MGTTIVYCCYIGMMEKKMETTIVYRCYVEDDGKENGNYRGILRQYRDKITWKLL